MPVRIFNSLTKQKEDLVPLDPSGKDLNIYTCGVTVYDKCHIGHARSLYIFDMIKRYLQFRGYKVHFVRNITDIDDKIINKAREMKTSSRSVAEDNIRLYYEDLRRLGIGSADVEPKATENIESMINHIRGLIDKDFAYVAQGDVYFRVRRFKEYGRLSGQSIDQMREAVRIDKDERKEDPLDFALWKSSKEGEPSWPSPWGEGRPGWHIECSCMSLNHLHCQTLDIHAGGRDLIFPHHENEIAQAEALTGRPFAKYWIHHGLLTINKQKMAKSLGNFITISDAIDKYGVGVLKIFFLSAHYASAIDFSEERMADAKKALQRLEIFLNESSASELSLSGKPDVVERARADFLEAMDDDFNTPRGLGVLYEMINQVYKRKDSPGYPGLLTQAQKMLSEILNEIFGLLPPASELMEAGLSVELKQLLDQRQEARARKDFRRSDEIRAALAQKGIVVEDTPQGQKWRKA